MDIIYIYIYKSNRCLRYVYIFAGYFIQDIVVAAIIGVVTGWCVGPLIPAFGHYLARTSILQFLLQLSILAMAISSQFFPYTMAAPKRVVFQHTFRTAGIRLIHTALLLFSLLLLVLF